jgi:hypothetical protein
MTLTLAETRARYPAPHPYHQLAVVAAQFAEHSAIADIWLTPDRCEAEIWLGMVLRADALAGTGQYLARLAYYVALRFGWQVGEVTEIEHPGTCQPQWAIIWEVPDGAA